MQNEININKVKLCTDDEWLDGRLGRTLVKDELHTIAYTYLFLSPHAKASPRLLYFTFSRVREVRAECVSECEPHECLPFFSFLNWVIVLHTWMKIYDIAAAFDQESFSRVFRDSAKVGHTTRWCVGWWNEMKCFVKANINRDEQIKYGDEGRKRRKKSVLSRQASDGRN